MRLREWWRELKEQNDRETDERARTISLLVMRDGFIAVMLLIGALVIVRQIVGGQRMDEAAPDIVALFPLAAIMVAGSVIGISAALRGGFGWMEGFSAYGFPKAHAASFAELAYSSAWMRTHFPSEFFAGLLNSQPMGFYSPRVLLNEARRIGLAVLPPDIHRSGDGFTVEEGGTALRVGLRYCKGLSKNAIEAIVSERRERLFSVVGDLYRRTSVERDALRNLARGGYLDSLAEGSDGRTRLLSEASQLPKKRRRDGGQPEMPLEHPSSWWIQREDTVSAHLPLAGSEAQRMQREVTRLDIGGHPLTPYREALIELSVVSSARMLTLPHGTRARAAGIIECLQRPPTKSGRPVYFLLIEDELGLLQATIFENVYRYHGHHLHHAGAFLLEGLVEQDARRGFSFLVERIRDLAEVLDGRRETVHAEAAVPGSGSFVRARKPGRRAG